MEKQCARGLGWAVVARGGGVLFSVHCVYFLWVRGYWSRVLQTLRSKDEEREVSRVGRKVARLTGQQWPVSSLLTALLSQCFSLFSAQSWDSSEPGEGPWIAFRSPVSLPFIILF